MPRKKKEDIELEYEFETFEDISSTTFEQPKKKNVLGRALETEIPESVYEEIAKVING